MIAANLPDFDLFYTGVGGDRLAYMLHHRGYTHTVVLAIAGAFLVWGVAWSIRRWRAGEAPPRGDARWLLALLMVSTLSHLALDWTNSYGVHPFWPIDDRWYYGDSVFIVEPWLWVASVPALVMATRSRVARVLLSLVLIAGLALAWLTSMVGVGAASALTAGAILSVLLARTLGADARVSAAFAGWLAVTGAMGAGAATARGAATRAVHALDPTAELLDVVVSPLPANAVCMSVIVVERDGATYRVVTARASAIPRIADAARCGTARGTATVFRASSRPSTRALHWDSEWSAPVAELAGLARESCVARAALRFIRVPAWSFAGDSTAHLGDVRFGGGGGGGFSDVTVKRGEARCDVNAPWVPPRSADMVRGAGGRVSSGAVSPALRELPAVAHAARRRESASAGQPDAVRPMNCRRGVRGRTGCCVFVSRAYYSVWRDIIISQETL